MLLDTMGCALDFYDSRIRVCKSAADYSNRRGSIKLPATAVESFRPGFLGRTPSGPVISWANPTPQCINTVSTRWHDWKTFAFDKTPSQLVLPSSNIVPCLGSICGTWAFEDDVEVTWRDIRLFVVDVDIRNNTGPMCNFVFSRRSFSPERISTCALSQKLIPELAN